MKKLSHMMRNAGTTQMNRKDSFFSKSAFLAAGIMFVLITQSLMAAGSVRGTVYDKDTNDPLPAANVQIKGTNIGTAADLNGVYSIPNAPAGRQILVISYMGYESQEIDVSIPDGGVLRQNATLEAVAVQGETVVVTAQAMGQIQAINQQLASNKIASIVSEARIQELPDFNAAQALSRLPGVSTLQSSGEANKVVIRGLAPKYNQITIGGVGLASTGSTQIGVASQGGTAGVIENDRSVDLSMMSPYMLKSISVYKALTPDLNADAIGGVVNMELREAPSGLHADLLWQSGYTQKSNRYGNYRAVGSFSTRLFSENLGVYFLGNLESYDRNADNMNASYIVTDSKDKGENGYLPVRVSSVTLNRHFETRKRYGVNLIADYRLNNGSIKSINMFSRLSSDYKDYRTIYDYQGNFLNFRYRGGDNDVDLGVNSLNWTQDFGFMSVDIKAANNYSRNNLPYSPEFQLRQTRGVGTSSVNTIPEDLVNLISYGGPEVTYLTELMLYSSDYNENSQNIKGDFKFPFAMGSSFNGYFKIGGEFKHKKHKNNQHTPYATLRGGSTINDAIVLGVLNEFPELRYDSTASLFPAYNFTSDDEELLEPFLDGQFGQILWAPDAGVLSQMTDFVSSNPTFSADSATAVQPGGWFDGYFQLYPNKYIYVERYRALYLMSEINFHNLMVVGGVRYEKVKGVYDAYNLKDGRDTKSQKYYPITSHPENEFWLPMVQSKYNLTKWLDIRYAYYQTLARPDYHQLSPHFTMGYSRNTVRAGNPNLRPAHAYNNDLILTLHSNKIGLLSVAGFLKKIKDFTYSTQYPLYSTAPEGLETVSNFEIDETFPLTGAILYTYINTPHPAYVRGFEVDFQSRTWYLPSFLNSIVFGINYTHIESEATYPWMDSRSDYSVRPPVTSVFDSTRTGRLVHQPNDIMNAYIGYDYKGFSARCSFIFQGNSVSYIGNFVEQDGFTRDYFRMDASARQLLPWYGMEIYLDLYNLNNESNISAQQSIGGFTSQQNYGFTGNMGVRLRL